MGWQDGTPVGNTNAQPAWMMGSPVQKNLPPAEPSLWDKISAAANTGAGMVQNIAATIPAIGAGALGVAGDIGKAITDKVQGKPYEPSNFAGDMSNATFNALAHRPGTPLEAQYTQNVADAFDKSKLAGLPVAGNELTQLANAIPQATNVIRPALSAAVSATGKALTPSISPEAADLAFKAQKYGIPIRPDMLMDNKIVKLMGGLLEQVPLSGAQGDVRQAAFNRALIGTIGGDTAASKLTPDVFDAAISKSGSTIGDIAQRNNIPLDVQTLTALNDHAASVAKFGTDESARIVKNYVNELISKAGDTGVIPGDAFKAINSQLGRQITGSADKYPLMQLQGLMQDALEKNLSGSDLSALQQARQYYSNAKTLEPLVAKAPTGDMSPAGVMGAVTSNKMAKSSMARGNRGEIGDIARVGQMMKEPGTSNTTERGIAALLLGGGGAINLPAATGVYTMANLYNRLGPSIASKFAAELPSVTDMAPAVAAQSADIIPAGGSTMSLSEFLKNLTPEQKIAIAKSQMGNQ